MKIRTDFITNSSSSSFVAFGIAKETLSRAIALSMEDAGEYAYNEYEDYSELLYGSELTVGGPDEEEYLGMEFETIMKNHPDIKISEIKQMVADKINEKFNTIFLAEDISYIEMGWFDG